MPSTFDSVSAASLAVATGTAVAAVASGALRRVTSRNLEIEFKAAESELLRALEQVATDDDPQATTWKELEEGNFQDQELRVAVRRLTQRVQRMETVSERIEIRRQALLETYHNQGLSQSRISFWFSLALGLSGFAVIAIAVLTDNAQTGTYVSGAVTEAVAALFFTQSNQARTLMSDFFDKLRDDRRLEESLKLTENIGDTQLKSSLQALLAMQLINATVSPTVLPGFHPETPCEPTTR